MRHQSLPWGLCAVFWRLVRRSRNVLQRCVVVVQVAPTNRYLEGQAKPRASTRFAKRNFFETSTPSGPSTSKHHQITPSSTQTRMSKVLVVCGYGPGIGHSVARHFGKHQYKVALLSRTAGKLETAAKGQRVSINAANAGVTLLLGGAVCTCVLANKRMLAPSLSMLQSCATRVSRPRRSPATSVTPPRSPAA